MNDVSLADIASVVRDNDGFGGGNSWTMIILFALIFGWGGNGFNRTGEFGQYATAASQQEILFGQQFQNLDNKMDRLANGIADATYALNNAVTTEGRNMQSKLADCCCSNKEAIAQVRYDMANFASAIQKNDDNNTQKILDVMCQNKIETLQAQINQLNLQNAMAGVVRYPNGWTYNAGAAPFCNCGTGCGTI